MDIDMDSLVDFDWGEALRVMDMMDNEVQVEEQVAPSNCITTPPPVTPVNIISTPPPISLSNFVVAPLNLELRVPPLNPTLSELESCSVIPTTESLSGKLSRALLDSKEWLGKGSLAQVWVPNEEGNMLSTSDHLYLLRDVTLYDYRQASKLFTFAAEPWLGSSSGLPSRVFASKVPEWTSKVSYYNHDEFLRKHLAVQHKVCGSLAVPVFEDDAQTSCCAVLELVTTQERPNFDAEMEAICNTLQAVELSSRRPPRINPQRHSLFQCSALGDINDVLRTICHANKLPLALTWIPCCYSERGGEVHVRGHNGDLDPSQKLILCIDKSACYWQNKRMEGFVNACTTHPLEPGQGIVGKSLQSNQTLMHPDVKQLHISDYPLVHHARRFGLGAGFVVRLRSAYTGPDDYIVEFFVPVTIKKGMKQENVLDKIASTTDKIYKSLMKVPNIQVVEENSYLLSCDQANAIPAVAVSTGTSERLASNEKVRSNANVSKNVVRLNPGAAEIIGNDPPKEAAGVAERGKKRWSNISASEIQQHFNGSLREAADSLGVGESTLKKICREKGIPRWPSRKMKKVNRSLKDVQTMLESAGGAAGGITFDLAAGKLHAAGSLVQLDPSKTFCFDRSEPSADGSTLPDKDHHKNKAPVVEQASTSFDAPSTSGGDGWPSFDTPFTSGCDRWPSFDAPSTSGGYGWPTYIELEY